MGPHRFVTALAALALVVMPMLCAASPVHAQGGSAISAMPRYGHIFLIVLENHGYDEIIGNPHAKGLNWLAQTYGLATDYYGVTHPSEPNYIALIGGSTFGIKDDAAYHSRWNGVDHTITASSLPAQLEATGLSWKAYQQALPYAGYKGVFYPGKSSQLYVSKHNPFLNFAAIQDNPAELRKIVPIEQLTTDLRSGRIPNFSFVAPDTCHDMHGEWPSCPVPERAGGFNDNALIRQSDAYVGHLVRTILASHIWAKGYNAILITWDENDRNMRSYAAAKTGCCDANPGGGHIATIVITSYGPRHARDNTPYNHYSLLRTIQAAFGLGCLRYTCDTAHVRSMWPLFIVGHRKPRKQTTLRQH